MFFLSFQIKAEETRSVTIAATDIEGLFSDANPGAYDVILKQLIAGYDNVSVMRGPILSIRRLFYSARADCLFVGINHPEFYAYKGIPFEKVIISNSLKTIKLRVFTLPGEKLVTDLADLQGQAVAYAAGISTLEAFTGLFSSAGIETLRVEKNIQAFQMLEYKRVAAVVAYDLDIIELSKHYPEVAKYPYDKSFAASESEDVMVCWKNEKNKKFMNHFNEKLSIMKVSGTLQEILSR